jgi:predicted metal-dependent peptidase
MHIYRSLPNQPGAGGCGGGGNGQGNVPDDLRPDPNTTPEELKNLEETQERVRSRAKQIREIQKARGVGTGDLLEVIDQLLHPKINWRKILENALVISLRDSYRGNWVKPRPTSWFFEYVSPGEFNEGKTNILIGIDTSGSISQEELQYYYGGIKQLMEDYEEEIGKVWLIQHDFEITYREEIDISQEEALPERIEIHGRGGTSHGWLPKVVEEIEEDDEEIGLIILLTDAESDLEQLDWPELPVVILSTGKEDLNLPPQVQIIPLLSP